MRSVRFKYTKTWWNNYEGRNYDSSYVIGKTTEGMEKQDRAIIIGRKSLDTGKGKRLFSELKDFDE